MRALFGILLAASRFYSMCPKSRHKPTKAVYEERCATSKVGSSPVPPSP